ncbi:Ig-like domain-containing protein [Candidatus Woesearchaeota archaeon]|nr:Ig-like domain-containing protein [Candidatus Woesearchaeota archaeon]
MEQKKEKAKKEIKEVLVIIIVVLLFFLFITNYAKIFEISSATIIDAATIFEIFAVSDTTTIAISIQTPVPNITTTPITTATEDVLYEYDVNATGHNLIFSVNSSGLFTINSESGLISFTPRNGQNGTHSINISAFDNNRSIDSQNYSLVISSVNDAPILNTVGDLTGETGSSNTYTVTATDEENDTLTFSIPSKDNDLSMTINSNTGVITIPSGNTAGNYSATIRVSDGNSNDDEDIMVNIVTTNTAPEILAFANSISNNLVPIIREDQNISYNITYNDDNGNNTVSIIWKQKNGSLSFDDISNGENFTFFGAVGSTEGTYQIKATISDGLTSVDSNISNLTVTKVKDSDGDGVFDYTDNCKFIKNANQADSNSNGIGDVCEDDLDGDGVDDSDDFIDGFASSINAVDSSGSNITVNFTINNDDNINQSFNGVKTVAITSTTIDSSTGSTIIEPIVEFDHNFNSANKLDLSNMSIKEETKVINGESSSVVVVSGISLGSGNTKTAYLEVLLDGNGVCIRDEEITNIDELSTDCSKANEKSIGCDGSTQNGFTCEKNTTFNKYKITGLSFSGIGEEECTESWSCTSYSACSNGQQTRTCTDSNNCGTTNNKPAESQSCGGSGESQAGGGGGGGGTTGRAVESKIKEGVRVLLIDNKLINVQVKKGDSFKKTIKIKNIASSSVEVNLEQQDELKGIISFPEPRFTLASLEEREIEILFNSGAGIVPGVYVGEIYAVYQDIREKIQAVIEIESLRTLFDVTLDIPLDYKKVLPGKEFRLQATIFDLSGLRSDVNVEFFIRNSKGNTILRESQIVRVQNQATFTKSFLIPEDIPLGEYIVGAIVKYKDSVGTSTKRFDVVGEKGLIEISIPNTVYYIGSGILMILIALFGLYLLQQRRLKSIEKSQSIRLKELEKKTPETEMEKTDHNKKLENELSLLEKSYKAGYITKSIYEKSKSKIEKLMK